MADSADDAAWERYVGIVSEVSGIQADKIHRDSLITRDLGLDSLASFELAVALVEKLEARDIESDLDRIDMRGLTVGAIFDRYLTQGQR